MHLVAYFIHEKLQAYVIAVRFASRVHELLARIGKGHAELTDQLHRASISLVLNTAEGAGEFSVAEKRRFYRMALRSGNECAATLYIFLLLGVIDATTIESLRNDLAQAVAMLTKLAIPSS